MDRETVLLLAVGLLVAAAAVVAVVGWILRARERSGTPEALSRRTEGSE